MSFETDVALNALPPAEVSRRNEPPTEARSTAAPQRHKVERKISLRKPPMWLRYGFRILAVAVALALWQMASTSQFHLGVNFENVPSPTVVWREFAALVYTKRFYVDLYVSIERIAIAFALASVSGVLIGILMGRFWLIEDLVSPYIEILRPIPAVAWIPIAILIMPTEESSIIFITFLGAFYPIVLNTVHGVAQTPSVLVRAARCLGASNRTILFRVILPSALPNIMTGLAVGMGIAWFSLLAGEIISGQYGIGYFTWASYTLVQYPKIIIGMLCIGVLGTASTSLVRLMTKPFLRWQADSNPRH